MSASSDANTIGFLRSVAPQLETAGVIAFLVIVVWCVLKFMVYPNSESMDDTDRTSANRLTNLIAMAVLGLTALILTISLTLTALTNRVPRQDVDRSGVYQQMNSH